MVCGRTPRWGVLPQTKKSTNDIGKYHNYPQSLNTFSGLEKNTGSKKQRVFKETKTSLGSLLSLVLA